MALNLRLSRIICSINSFSSMVKISATIAITSIMIDQIFSTTVSSCTPSYISANNPPMVSSPCSSGAQAWIRNTLPCVFRSGSLCHACGCSASRAAGPKTLFLAIDLPSLAVNREVHDKLRAAVAPAQGQQLVAENAPLKHVREYLANTLHPQSGLRQVGIIHNKHCRKMALLIVFPYGHGLDEMTGDVPDDVASLYCPWP